MQPWTSGSRAAQQAAQQSQQSAMRAAEQSARNAMDAGRAAAEAGMRGAQFRPHAMHTGSSYRRGAGGGFGFFRLVGGFCKLAILAGIILVALKLSGVV